MFTNEREKQNNTEFLHRFDYATIFECDLVCQIIHHLFVFDPHTFRAIRIGRLLI